MTTRSYTWFHSPVGPLLLAGSRDGLNYVSFSRGRHAVAVDSGWTEDGSLFQDAIRQLCEYFAGERKTFSLTLSPQGTDFQKAMWSALEKIRRNDLLQATGRAHWQTEGGSRCGCGEWGEPHSHHHSLPPGDRP